jgi:hypothetical protein
MQNEFKLGSRVYLVDAPHSKGTITDIEDWGIIVALDNADGDQSRTKVNLAYTHEEVGRYLETIKPYINVDTTVLEWLESKWK